MRVLYLTFDDLTRPYAWSVHVRAIVNGLVDRGHEVRLVCPGGEAPGIRAPSEALSAGRWSHFAGSLATFVGAGRSQRSDVLYVRGIHLSLTPAYAADLLGKPLVVEVNGRLEYEVPPGWRRSAVRIAHRITLARTARVVTVSQALRQGLASDYGYPERRIDVVPNGADLERFRPSDRDEARRRLGLPADRPVVVCVASFYPHHGRRLLVEAAGRAGAFLVLVGGESESSASVWGVGPVPHERVPDYLAAADVCAYVLRAPDPSFSFSPLKVYEYMAAGRPVAAAVDLPELRELVNGSGAGIATEPDVGALASSIRALLDDPARREAMGRRGRALAEAEFGWARAAGRVEAALRASLTTEGRA